MDQPTIFDWTAPVETNGFGSGESALLGLPAEVMAAIFGNNSCEKILELRLVSGFKPIIDANIREIYSQMRRQDPYLPAIWPPGTPRAKSDHENFRLFQNECKFADKLVPIGGDEGLDWRLREAAYSWYAHLKNGPAQAVYYAQKLLRSDKLWDPKKGHRDAYETHARRWWGRADDKKKSLNVFLFYVKNGVTPLTAYYFATAVETWVQPWFPRMNEHELEEAGKSIFGTRKSRHAPLSFVRAIDTASEKLRKGPSVLQSNRDRPIKEAVALFANEIPVERLPEAFPDDTKEELDVYRPDYTAGALIKEANKIVARMQFKDLLLDSGPITNYLYRIDDKMRAANFERAKKISLLLDEEDIEPIKKVMLEEYRSRGWTNLGSAHNDEVVRYLGGTDTPQPAAQRRRVASWSEEDWLGG